ncbi:S26 family signal peptidase [Pararhizobium mangrovi]|uniref:S26 family signal peptidase n=1 Tax=Pararhizobium mangrovi TaxID=2590452 RepID=A0A506U3X1_9HYPH|nr:S26 family signal peptidase [Pararhizobium mangrovi]TPW27705.1 S26 family signal peptidase [Pararhizobium mangrovi]
MKRRPTPLLLGGLAVAAMLAPAIVAMPTRLVWNASASVPIGLYAVRPAGDLSVSDLVVAMPPAPLDRFLAARRYIGSGVPLIKHVAALGGQTVCRHGDAVTVDGAALATARDRDGRGRPLPRWHGCRTLGDGDVLLVNAGVADSMDGRYFGPLPRAAIIGRATPIWTRSTP